jgi:hypothetical protein
MGLSLGEPLRSARSTRAGRGALLGLTCCICGGFPPGRPQKQKQGTRKGRRCRRRARHGGTPE